MSRRLTVIHIALFSVSVLILAASLLFWLMRWSSLPDMIGVHFGPDGEFDVIGEKANGFYPHIVCAAFIAGTALAQYLSGKIKTGLHMSADGERSFRAVLLFTLDIVCALISFFFAAWSRSVALQIPLDTDIVVILTAVILVVSAAGGISLMVIYRRTRQREEGVKSGGRLHSVSRLAAWLLTAAGIGILVVSWNIIPYNNTDPELIGMFYSPNLGTFLDKRLLLIPHTFIILLLILFEVLSARAAKADKTALVNLCDRLKLICGVFFFWWDILLCDETEISIVSVCMFLLLCAGSVIIFFRKKRKRS